MTKRRICISTYFGSEFGRQVLAGIGEAASAYDWDLTCVSTADLKPHLVSSFDGLICNVHSRGLAAEIARHRRPVVNLLHLDDKLETVPSVRTDHLKIGQLAAEHLYERRFVNFAYCGCQGIAFSDLRGAAFLSALEKLGRSVSVYAFKSRQTTQYITSDRLVRSASDAKSLTAWLRSLPKPIGIFCCNDERASGLAEVCQRIKLNVPSQVAILGVDNDTVIDYLSHPQISSIDPDAQAVGRTAVEMLADQFGNRKSRSPKNIRTVPPKRLIARGSTEIFPVQPEWLAQALVFIHRNAAKNISATDVVRHVGYSHTFVQRAFREKLDSTIQREIARTRLAEANRLLSLGELKIGEIVKLCGFSSFQYFCNCYTSAFGHSPSQFSKASHAESPLRMPTGKARRPGDCAT